MTKAQKVLILCGLILAVSLPAGTGGPLAGDAAVPENGSDAALQIGLDIQFDADWVFFSGVLSLKARDDRAGNAPQKVVGEVRLGGLPNLIEGARRGITLVRAVRTTTLCLVRQWLKD